MITHRTCWYNRDRYNTFQSKDNEDAYCLSGLRKYFKLPIKASRIRFYLRTDETKYTTPINLVSCLDNCIAILFPLHSNREMLVYTCYSWYTPKIYKRLYSYIDQTIYVELEYE